MVIVFTDTKACRKCGAQFKKSRQDTTVNCPKCRVGYKAPVAVKPYSRAESIAEGRRIVAEFRARKAAESE